MAFVGIDIGTSFIKGAILNADTLSISHILRVPFSDPIPDLPPLFREFDPQSVLTVIKEMLSDLVPYAGTCEGVLMCSQMHGLVLSTEQGDPLSKLTTWQDQRVLQPHPSGQGTYFSVMQQHLGPDMVRQLGNELRPGQPLGVLFWMIEQNKLPRMDAFPLSLPDFVLSNLCHAKSATELTHAASHGALNLETGDWHHEILHLLGLQSLNWPNIYHQGEIVGHLRIGSQDIPCFTPVGDYQCALAGSLLAHGELSINISTGSQVSLLQAPEASSSAIFGDYQTRPFFDGHFLSTITHIPAGRALNALVKLLVELAEVQGLPLVDPWPIITRRAAEVGQTQMHVNLAFFDSACGDHGAITNIREAELSVGNIFRSAFQNMAENYYSCALQLSPDQEWDHLVLSGGLAQVDVLRQLISEKFQKEYRLCPTSEDTLLGLLALALAFSGRTESLQAAEDELSKTHQKQNRNWISA